MFIKNHPIRDKYRHAEHGVIQMPTKIEKIVKRIIADGNGEFEGFLQLPITEQQNVIDLYEDLITWEVRKHYSPMLSFDSDTPLEDKLEVLLQSDGEDIKNEKCAEEEEDGWCCNDCGDISAEHPLVHIYRKHYIPQKDQAPKKRNIKLILVWKDGNEDWVFAETSAAPTKIRTLCEHILEEWHRKRSLGEWEWENMSFIEIPVYVASKIGTVIPHYKGNYTQIETYWIRE